MRMRKKKHGNERILACSHFLIGNPVELRDDPQKYFEERRPLHLEIGCGKGSFAAGLTSARHDINLIAMEKISDVAVTALERAMASADTRPDNLRFIIGDAKMLAEYFPPNSIDTIYINFCDPWPKKGHTKRRLTYKGFLDIYKYILKEDGMLVFKTDNQGLFDFSMEEFEKCGLEIVWSTRDLHGEQNEYAKNNIVTEYEKNFSEKGFKICSAHVRFPSKK